jgi:hypothetical protein
VANGFLVVYEATTEDGRATARGTMEFSDSPLRSREFMASTRALIAEVLPAGRDWQEPLILNVMPLGYPFKQKGSQS